MMASIPLDGGDVSHREKLAWLSLLALATAFGPWLVVTALDAPPSGAIPDVALLTRFGLAALVQMAILGVGHLVLRLRFPVDARAPADERDRAIERRAMRIAYYVLITGVIVAGVVMPFSEGGAAIFNSAVTAIVVAEFVHYGAAVWGYRRGFRE